MAEKKNIENKAEKKTTAKKTTAKKSIDWQSLPDIVVIISKSDKHMKKGQEYTISKKTAQILVAKGLANLK